MKKETISKELIGQLLKVKGEVRGVVFKTDEEYILKEKGKKGLVKLEERLQKLGVPIRYEQIKTMDFYPVGLRALSLLAIREVFDFDDNEIRKMGLFATKMSLVIKLFVKYFLSLEKVFFEQGPKIWAKHWTTGKLIPSELNKEKKYGILSVERFTLHPIFCLYLEGYFSGILQMVIKSSKITVTETKCIPGYHEYRLSWE